VPGEEVEEAPEDLGLLDREPLTRPGWPKLSFIERNMAGDCTNWWAPNRACMEAMLRSTGMKILSRPMDEFYICEPDPQSVSNMWSWNEEEYWAAIGRTQPAGNTNGESA
jgi:tRNA (mo5U34)-methyltransferase